MSEDQRREPRISRGFMIRYRAAGDASGWLVSPLRDLSRSGARFFSERAFDVGTVLDAFLVLPASDAPVALQATVARSQPGPLGMAELGVAFQPPDTVAQGAINAAVARFLARGSGRA